MSSQLTLDCRPYFLYLLKNSGHRIAVESFFGRCQLTASDEKIFTS